MKARYIFLILVAVSVIILLPPVIHHYIYPNGSDDSGWHLITMQAITLTNPIPESTLYAGEWIAGYPLMLLERFVHIPITTSFMWFSYLVLVVLVWSNYFVFSKLFNRATGLLVGLGSFLIVRTNVEFFLAGQIFNLINMGIIFPWMLYFISKAAMRNSWRYALVSLPIIALFGFFHPTGWYLLAIIPLCLVVYWQRKRIKTEGMFALLVIGSLIVTLFIMSFPFWHLSFDPGRQGTDAFGLLLLSLMIIVGWRFASGKALVPITMLVAVVGGIYIFPVWFRYINAFQPVDEQAIAYIKTLPEGEFYGNEYLAYWVYQPYIGKSYRSPIPNHPVGIYVWRSEPMTAGTTPSYEYQDMSRKGQNVSPPQNMRNVKYFEGNGVTIYVAESGGN